MDIAALSNAASSQTTRAGSSLTANFDTFLTLLTAQLQNQDPLEPTDTAEFTRQLVQYSGVEQQINTNKNLETLIAMQQQSAAGLAVSYVGKDVIGPGNTARLSDGAATWHYGVPSGASEVAILVRDANGRVVYAAEGAATPGINGFQWDGNDSRGNPMPDGIYSISVSGRAADGSAVTITPMIRGRVSAVDFVGTEPLLNVNGIGLPMSKVTSVIDPAATI